MRLIEIHIDGRKARNEGTRSGILADIRRAQHNRRGRGRQRVHPHQHRRRRGIIRTIIDFEGERIVAEEVVRRRVSDIRHRAAEAAVLRLVDHGVIERAAVWIRTREHDAARVVHQRRDGLAVRHRNAGIHLNSHWDRTAAHRIRGSESISRRHERVHRHAARRDDGADAVVDDD